MTELNQSDDGIKNDEPYQSIKIPDNNTIIPAENMDDECTTRAERVKEIVERLKQSDEEPKSTEFPQGKIVGEFESLERENSRLVEETGNNDYLFNKGFSDQTSVD